MSPVGKYAATGVAGAALGAALVYWFQPISKTETVYKDRIVTQFQVVTTTKEVVLPNGTKQIETVTTDNSKKTQAVDSTAVSITHAPNWHVAAGAGLNKDLQSVYNVKVERRILGPVFLGAEATTERSGYITIGIEF